jgi:Na+/proline symporter
MASNSIAAIDFGIIIVYVLMLLGVGYYVYRRETSFEEYLLAGRSMTTPVLICSLASTYYGLDVLFGSTELAYNDGIVAFFGYSLLTLVVYLFAAVAAQILPADMHTNDALLMAVMHALPVGLTGIFLAGVLATTMSTMDSYTLVAGANFSYDLYRPLINPQTTDTELVRVTKIGVVAAWVLGFVVAFAFERIMALLVFVITILTATVLVAIMVGVFYKGRKTALAGLLSCSTGLISVLAFYVVIAQMGEYDDVYGTYIWSFTFAGDNFSIWQEYSLFFCLPLSAIVVFAYFVRDAREYIEIERRKGNDSGGGPTKQDR